MGNEPATKNIRSHCRNCGRSTNHEILAEQIDTTSEGLNPWSAHHSMIRCLGCGTISLREQRGWLREPDKWETTIYPPPMARRTPVWLTEASFVLDDFLPDPIYRLMRETYIAVQNDLMRLAAMGVRATLENLMIERVGDKGSFIQNLNALHEAGDISAKSRTSLETIIEAGSAAIHRAWEPSKEDVCILLDITESIIETIYVHEKQSKVLASKVPKRERTKKS